MLVYLPIAEMPVSALLMFALGGAVGFSVGHVRRRRRFSHDADAHFCRRAERRCRRDGGQSPDRLLHYRHDRSIPAQECRHQARPVSSGGRRGRRAPWRSHHQVSEADRADRSYRLTPLRRLHELCRRHDVHRKPSGAAQSAPGPAGRWRSAPPSAAGSTGFPSRRASRHRNFISAQSLRSRSADSWVSCPASWVWEAASSWFRS